MKYFIAALKKRADFSGRAGRKEFWMYTLIYSILFIAFAMFDWVMSVGLPLLTLGFFFLTFIPTVSVSVRRLHDTGRSGWWYLVTLIPWGIGGIIFIVFALQDSQDKNKYGPRPLGIL